MKTFKELINELDTETLKSHGKKRIDQSVQTWHRARQASKEGDSKKSYDLDMQAHALGQKAAKSLFKAARRKPDTDSRGYDQPNRYHGD